MANKGDKIVGASAKLARARQLNAMGMLDLKSGAKIGGVNERVYSTILLIFFAGLLAWRLGEGPLKSGAFGKSGIPVVDEMVLAPSPVYLGDPTMDWGIALALRTLLLLLAAGLIPALAWMWVELIDRPLISPYRVCWGMTLVVAGLALFMEPIFAMIMSNFVMLFG